MNLKLAILLVTLVAGFAAKSAFVQATNLVRPAKFAPPPVSESAGIGKLIDEAESRLKNGATTSTLLSDAKFDSARAWPRFRNAVREYARAAPLQLVSPSEAGAPLIVNGRVLDASGTGVSGALVYVYQTDALGLYAENAIHVGGVSGDWRHARLFGYLKTGVDGKFQLRTVRPASYPESELPQHIHVGVEHEKSRLTTEIGFDDDPMLSPVSRSRFRLQGNVVASVILDADGRQVATADVVLR